MTVTVIADSLEIASPLICRGLRETVSVEVFIPTDFQGYWASLKTTPGETTRDLKRNLRMYKNPQPYDVQLTPWPAWMYQGISQEKKSSAF